MITLAFYKGWRLRPSYLIQDGAIRLVTWSRYSHVNNPEAWFCSEACSYAVTGHRDTPSPGEQARSLGLPLVFQSDNE